VTARDLPSLLDLFGDPAVLIGIAGDGRTSEARVEYLAHIAAQEADVRWVWADKRPFYESDGALGFAGQIVLSADGIESRSSFRLTLFATRAASGWRIRQFHGSAPQSTANG
jgi:hypothetical protein